MLGRLSYNISNGLTAGVNLSYDQAFETRFSADLKYRFGSNGYGAPPAKKEWKLPVIQALTENVKHRDVRVHNLRNSTCGGCGFGETGVGRLAPDPEQPIGYQGAT